ncbi:hypothetical protein CC80DRAFT_170361 [Byssothecium circinans]|uniref:Uncharacterized protein n=1 Tax=Byssothecium circinans TaxID=147558 RepID=A0A6A5TM69_9PLEO|nr:hypothetical protein CC80DRAFT_170361 [Byssothecium circinans]
MILSFLYPSFIPSQASFLTQNLKSHIQVTFITPHAHPFIMKVSRLSILLLFGLVTAKTTAEGVHIGRNIKKLNTSKSIASANVPSTSKQPPQASAAPPSKTPSRPSAAPSDGSSAKVSVTSSPTSSSSPSKSSVIASSKKPATPSQSPTAKSTVVSQLRP